MTRTSILSVIPTLESGPGSQRLRSPNCVPGRTGRPPPKGRGTEYGGPDRTQRAESFRNDGEILPLCRYATKHPERPSRPTRTEGPVPAGRTRPCPTASENTNPKPKIPHHETSASSARVAVPRPTQCGARRQNLPKPGRLSERPIRDRARPVSETARRRSRIRTLRIQARLHGPGNEKDAQGNDFRRCRRYALRELGLFVRYDPRKLASMPAGRADRPVCAVPIFF